MAVITPVIGDGATLQYCTTSGGSYATLGKIEKFKGPAVKADEIKTTKIDDAAVTRQPGIPDYGRITLSLRYAQAMAAILLGYMNNKTMIYLKAGVNDGSTPTVVGPILVMIEDFDPFGEVQLSKELISDITFAISGTPTFTSGT